MTREVQYRVIETYTPISNTKIKDGNPINNVKPWISIKKKQVKNRQRTISGLGLTHEGSFRAQNIENEDSNAAFEMFVLRSFVIDLGSAQHLKTNSLIRARFDFVIWPRAETSKEKWNVLYTRDRSAIKGAYFSSLYVWLRSIFESHGHVSSKTSTSRLASS